MTPRPNDRCRPGAAHNPDATHTGSATRPPGPDAPGRGRLSGSPAPASPMAREGVDHPPMLAGHPPLSPTTVEPAPIPAIPGRSRRFPYAASSDLVTPPAETRRQGYRVSRHGRFMETTVVNVRTCRDFGSRPDDVYIGRACGRFRQSKWANPFPMRHESERDKVIQNYRAYLVQSGLMADVAELRGKRLGCWCAPLPCHGNVLAELAEASSPSPAAGLTRIISGGQTGADQGGLMAGNALGLGTGGFAPRGYITEAGPAPDLLGGLYALTEMPTDSYPDRTRANVLAADGTVVFAPGNGVASPGTRLTLRVCRETGKPYLLNPESPAVLRAWADAHGVRVLNVAGNRESRAPGLQDRVAVFVEAAFSLSKEEEGDSLPF